MKKINKILYFLCFMINLLMKFDQFKFCEKERERKKEKREKSERKRYLYLISHNINF